MNGKRTRKVCDECGKPYHSIEQHKVRACARNLAFVYAGSQQDDARAGGWVPVGDWRQTVEKCEIPTAFFDVVVLRDGEIKSHEYAQAWVMRIIKCKGPSSALRAAVVNRMFADPEERKFFDSCMALQARQRDVRGLIRQMGNRIYNDRISDRG